MQYTSTMTLEDIAEEFVGLCYDFRYLRHKKSAWHDPREEQARQMFIACGNRSRMESAMRDVHTGDYTFNELLRKKGFTI